MPKASVVLLLAVVALALPGGEASTLASGATTERISVASDGAQGDDQSIGQVMSFDGRYVAFDSYATNLVAGDTNGLRDVFVHDRETDSTERVSIASDGSEANLGGGSPAMSGDGQHVAFGSSADNLVPEGLPAQLFVHHRQTGITELVSVASNGSVANSSSQGISISNDGRYVAYASRATNLVAKDDNNNALDVYVRDLALGTTELVSVTSGGQAGSWISFNARISGDGRYVAFTSYSIDLVPDDTNNKTDIFVRDRETDSTERVSIASDGSEANGPSGDPDISADGRFVAFVSGASNLVPGGGNGIYVHDREADSTEVILIATATGELDGISGDGRYVVFRSHATNLVADDTNNEPDIFVHDRDTDSRERVSVAYDGSEANDGSARASISGDGRYVGFLSQASNLVLDDTNETWDVFVYDRQFNKPMLPKFRLPWRVDQEGPDGGPCSSSSERCGWRLGILGLYDHTPGIAALDFIHQSQVETGCPAPVDTSIHVASVGAGTVKIASNNTVEIEHANGWRSHYFHVENIGSYVQVDDQVGPGEPIGNPSCSGGTASVRHVHFTMKRPDGSWSAMVGEVELCGWQIQSEKLVRQTIEGQPIEAQPIINGTIACARGTKVIDTLLFPGQTIETPLTMAVGQVLSTFMVFWSGSTVNLTLVAPDASEIGPATTNPNVYHSKGDTYELYDISSPQSGEWTIRLYGADVPAEGESTQVYFMSCPEPPGGGGSDPCVAGQAVGGIAELPVLATERAGSTGSPISNAWLLSSLAGAGIVAVLVFAGLAMRARRRRVGR